MSGSRPLPLAVTASTGISCAGWLTDAHGAAAEEIDVGAGVTSGGGPAGSPSPQRIAPAFCWTAMTNTGFVGPRLDALELAALYGCGVPLASMVDDGRPWKYLADVKFWPISDEPMTLPSFSLTRLPSARS